MTIEFPPSGEHDGCTCKFGVARGQEGRGRGDGGRLERYHVRHPLRQLQAALLAATATSAWGERLDRGQEPGAAHVAAAPRGDVPLAGRALALNGAP